MKWRPEIDISHVDVAVRWKSNVNRSRLLQVTGGPLQAFRDIIGVVYSIVHFRPQILNLTMSEGCRLEGRGNNSAVEGIWHSWAYPLSNIAGCGVSA